MDVFLTALQGQMLEAHGKLRDLVAGLDAEALNWSPGADTNSLAVLITHALGSERLVLMTVAQRSVSRDREAEFRARASTPAELAALIEAANGRVREILPALTEAQLAAEVDLFGSRRTGAAMLVSTFGHLREHLAHAELTRQLYQAGRTGG